MLRGRGGAALGLAGLGLAALGLAALGLVASLAAGCRDGGPPAPRRRFDFARITFDPRGISPPLRVQVPSRTRSIAVVVRGDPGALYALAALEISAHPPLEPRPFDPVAVADAADLRAEMRRAYFDERSGAMPGRMSQTIRLGLFTAIHPDRPDVLLVESDLVVRVATTVPARPADVTILLPETLPAGPAVLPVVLFMWSPPRAGGAAHAVDVRGDAGDLPFVARLRSILAAGGIELRVERVIEMNDPAFARMTELSEPQEPPTSESARLAVSAGARVEGDALNLFIVDALPPGVGGWTLGTPGPPLADTIYSGVVAARLDGGDELARVLAHEIGHYLGLWHVDHVSRSGARTSDPLDDTEPWTDNLMEEHGRGTRLTRDQGEVMRLHPLVRPR